MRWGKCARLFVSIQRIPWLWWSQICYMKTYAHCTGSKNRRISVSATARSWGTGGHGVEWTSMKSVMFFIFILGICLTNFCMGVWLKKKKRSVMKSGLENLSYRHILCLGAGVFVQRAGNEQLRKAGYRRILWLVKGLVSGGALLFFVFIFATMISERGSTLHGKQLSSYMIVST